MSDLIFHYKVLGSPVKLSHAEMNQNLRSIEDAVGIVKNAELVSSEASDLAVNAGSVAVQAKEDAVTAKGQAESAREDAVIAKNAAEQARVGAQAAKETAVSANQSAQGAKTAAELARNDSVAARNIAQTSATTATSAKNAAETARNTATQKANEANQSAIDAEYWAGLSEESAGEVTSVQGKKGKVDLKRVDFSWMGDAAEKTVVFNRTEGTAGRLVDTLWRGLGGPINLDGTLPISEQITSNGLFLHSKGSNPYPPDSPDPTAINLLTLGAVGWHSQFAFSAYSNRVYTRCRVSANGEYRDWAEFYTTLSLKQATQVELNAGTQTAPRLFSPKQLAAKSVPAGTVITFAAESAPEGYLKCNGALVSRTAYSALFANIGTAFGEGDGSTTFALPDLRGEFVRGWDDGRGVDGSRPFGSSQSDLLGSHSHDITASNLNNNAGKFVHAGARSTPNTDISTESAGGTETRPRNIALLSCIKY